MDAPHALPYFPIPSHPTLLYTAPPIGGWMPSAGKRQLQRDPTIQSAGRVGRNWGINRANGPFNIERQFLHIMPWAAIESLQLQVKSLRRCFKQTKSEKMCSSSFKQTKWLIVASTAPTGKPNLVSKFASKCYEVIYQLFRKLRLKHWFRNSRHAVAHWESSNHKCKTDTYRN